jgi:hypothetical protein
LLLVTGGLLLLDLLLELLVVLGNAGRDEPDHSRRCRVDHAEHVLACFLLGRLCWRGLRRRRVFFFERHDAQHAIWVAET